LLVLAQVGHSVEEYAGRLWESFPPARFLTGLLSSDRERGFLAINILLAAFGVWCWMGPVRRSRPSARALVGFWVALEIVNGVGHPVWSFAQGGYTPGVATAPVLLALALVVLRLMPSAGERR
jgi:hypothetical protein